MRSFNPNHTKQYRKELRNFPTASEFILWDCLCERQIEGVKFRRQFGVGSFIADFFAFEILLAIEVDGEIHLSKEAQEYDRMREKYFANLGILTIRFTNGEIRSNLPAVVEQIQMIVSGRIAQMPLVSAPGRKSRKRSV